MSDGVSAQRALALDPLQGVQQELIIEAHPAGLTIANLLARDYPILSPLDTG